MIEIRPDEAIVVKVLFWNIRQQPLFAVLGDLIREHSIDIVAIAECGLEPEAARLEIQSACDFQMHLPSSGSSRVVVISRLGGEQFREVDLDMTSTMTIRSAHFGGQEFLWAFVHLSSKLYRGEADQAASAREVSHRLREIEFRRGHRRTIICGDFNMNPFERGMAEAGGFHAMMARNTVLPGSRIVQSQEFPFFYNPMWGLFGDRTTGPPGTYFSRRSGHLSYDWNMFDQVLMRRDVMSFLEDSPRILQRVGDKSLMTPGGRPNKKRFSDHLPLVFSLNLN